MGPSARSTRSDSKISEIPTFNIQPPQGHDSDSKDGTEFREGRFPLFPTVAGTCRVVKPKVVIAFDSLAVWYFRSLLVKFGVSEPSDSGFEVVETSPTEMT